MSEPEIRALVLQVATEAARKGPGWSQEGVVLREVSDRIARERCGMDLTGEQAILNVWHDLFFERQLSWGYDLGNPGSPFFHVRKSS